MELPKRGLTFYEPLIATIAAVGIAAHLVLRFALPDAKAYADFPLFFALAAGGIPLVLTLLRKLWAAEFGSDLLAGISIVTAVVLHQYLVAAIVVLMLSSGASLERFAERRASSVLEALARRMPSVAHRQSASGMADVRLDEIAVGDVLVVLPHEICPVDGTVIEGRGVMDESYLTGEPFMIAKTVGSNVLSGAINADTAVTVQASKLAVDSRYASIMRVVEESQQKRPRLRRVGDLLGAWYTPVAVSIAAFAWASSGDVTRFLSVLVIATPCPLLLAIPVAVIGAISVAAGRSIVIRNPAVLELAGECRTLLFDKTGTLTTGKPVLTDVVCGPGVQRGEVLRLAGSLEQYSKHPLAGAVIRAMTADQIAPVAVERMSEKPGEGLRGVVAGRDVQITGRKQVAARGYPLPEAAEGLECVVLVEGAYAATLRFHDEPRADSAGFIGHLLPRHFVTRILLVSGDREQEVRYLAERVGIQEVYAGQSPEQKLEIVTRETKAGKTLFVGDGINDAPSLIAATVGVAFGGASDITSEAADAVILEPSLAKVDELIHIGRRMRNIALQSALGGMGLSVIGMALAAFGHLPPLAGAVAQEIIDLAAVLNAVRSAWRPRRLTDF
jgi:heavy metal translocating P-type ATPase